MRNNLKELVYYTIGPFLAKILSFLLLPIISYFITIEDYGTYTLFTVLLMYLVPALSLSTEQYFLRWYTPERGVQIRKIFLVLYCCLAFLSLLFGVILIKTRIIQFDYFIVFELATITAMFTAMAELYIRTFRTHNLGQYYSLVVIIGQLFSFVSQLILVIVLKSVMGLIIGQLISALIQFVVSLSIEHHKILPSELSSQLTQNKLKIRVILTASLKYSIPLLPGVFLWVLQNSIGRLFLADSAKQLGIYGVGFKFATITSLFVTSFLTFWEPILYKEYDNFKERDSYVDEITKYKRLYTLIIEFLIIIVVIANPLLMRVMSGSYREAMYVIPVMILNNYTAGYSYFSGFGPQLTGETARTLVPLALSLLMNVTILLAFSSNNVLTVNIADNISTLFLVIGNTFITKKIIKDNVNINYDILRIILYNVVSISFYYTHNYIISSILFILIFLYGSIKTCILYHKVLFSFIKRKINKI